METRNISWNMSMPVWKMQNAKVTLTHYCIFSVVAVGAVGRRLFSFSVNVLLFIFIDNRNVYVLVISMHIGGINDIIHNHFNVYRTQKNIYLYEKKNEK